MKLLSPILLVLLLPCMPACELAGMYDQEYVFYDPDGEAEAAAEAEAESKQAETALPPPQTQVPAEPGAQSSLSISDLDRLFQLEAVLDELNRAIQDGLDHDGRLTAKRGEVELELVRRKRVAGEAYGQERRRRLQVLQNFATQKDR